MISRMIQLTAERIRRAGLKRDEAGAGGLLPIVVIGTLIVAIAAFIATSTSFAAKVSYSQTAQMTSSIETNSLLNIFTTNLSSGHSLDPELTVQGSGSYKVYYSSQDDEPKSVVDDGVYPLSGSSVPSDSQWILIALTPESGEARTALYSISSLGSPVHDDLINWSGPVLIDASTISAATGVQGPIKLSLGGNQSEQDSALRIADSTVSADIYSDYQGVTEIDAGTTVKGHISSYSSVQLNGVPKVLGNVYSENLILGLSKILGTENPNSLTRPTSSARINAGIALRGDVVELQPEDCSTSTRLRETLELAELTTTFTGAEVCSQDSWYTEVKLNTDVTIHSNGDLEVSDLTVKGPSNLSFVTDGNLKLSRVTYTDGAAGEFVASGALEITDSLLNGYVASFGSSNRSLAIANSTLLYKPLMTSLVESCGANSCAIGSDSIHLVRIR